MNLEALLTKWRDQGVDWFVEDSQGRLRLSKIIIPVSIRAQGIGSACIVDLNAFADAERKMVVLTPSKDFGGNLARLKRFYKRHGYIENKGRHKNYAFMDTFFRMPKHNQLQISGCSDEWLWYSSRIGETFEWLSFHPMGFDYVENSEFYSDCYQVNDPIGNITRTVRATDVAILRDSNEM